MPPLISEPSKAFQSSSDGTADVSGQIHTGPGVVSGGWFTIEAGDLYVRLFDGTDNTGTRLIEARIAAAAGAASEMPHLQYRTGLFYEASGAAGTGNTTAPGAQTCLNVWYKPQGRHTS